jgi:hypothetical protein
LDTATLKAGCHEFRLFVAGWGQRPVGIVTDAAFTEGLGLGVSDQVDVHGA